jgi:Ser/Thr protein kinase RdoA (MazF antagonist)
MQSKSKASVSEVTLRGMLELYGYTGGELLTVQKGYRNEALPYKTKDGRVLNLMLYKNDPEIIHRIKNADSVSNFLAARGLPARCSADDRIIKLQSSSRQKYAALYHYLPGETIPWEAYTRKHLKLLGKTMSDMHAELCMFDAGNLPDVADEYLEIVERMRRYFAHPGARHALAAKLQLRVPETVFDQFAAVLGACGQLPGRQALHMDFVRSNILFNKAGEELEISGILDFEKTARGIPHFDVARTLAFLNVDCKYKPADKVRKYFLQSGYQKRGNARLQALRIKTGAGSVDVLERLVDLFLFYDFYKFLRHNPYESLPQNEHFVRTCELCMDRWQICDNFSVIL